MIENKIIIESVYKKIFLYNHDVILHPDIMDILFKYKGEIYKRFMDIRGIYLIDHIAIKIIDPENKIIIFSMTPSVEYNLIVNELWRHDNSFSVWFNKNNIFYSWEKAYSKSYFYEIKEAKELKHGFTFGFNLSKKIKSFYLIYSYATRSRNTNLFEYYYNHAKELFSLGDYSYKLICDIYSGYCNPEFDVPSIICQQHDYKKPVLQLIKNNGYVYES